MDQIYMLIINNKIVDYIEYLSIFPYGSFIKIMFNTGPLLK